MVGGSSLSKVRMAGGGEGGRQVKSGDVSFRARADSSLVTSNDGDGRECECGGCGQDGQSSLSKKKSQSTSSIFWSSSIPRRLQYVVKTFLGVSVPSPRNAFFSIQAFLASSMR
jgi:hypothetical protein